MTTSPASKPLDDDLREVLFDLELQIGIATQCADDEDLKQLRLHETVLRRLLREAGYIVEH